MSFTHPIDPKNAPEDSFILAPMEGVTTLPLRIWLFLTSAPQSMGTPFLRITATFPGLAVPRFFAPELLELKSYVPYELTPQFMATEADDFLRAAQNFLMHTKGFIELNSGCPSPTCVGKGAGSSLLKDPQFFFRMLERISSRIGSDQFALKMRSGYATESEFPVLLEGLKDIALARLTVHARTRVDRYKGHAKWDLIHQASRVMTCPVVASGDVLDHTTSQERKMLAPDINRVMVGRGALRNPWIFEELRSQKPVDIRYDALKSALLCHALLHELSVRDQARFHEDPLADFALFRLIREGLLEGSCHTDAAAWHRITQLLVRALIPQDQGTIDALSIEVSKVTMGRLKLLWNYLRSSLPLPFSQPEILRSPSLASFFYHLDQCQKEFQATVPQHSPIPLRYNPSWDWVYSGETKPS